RRNSRLALLFLFWSGGSVLLVFVASHIVTPFFLYRGFLTMTIPVYLLTARAIVALPALPLRAGAIFVFAAIAAIPLSEIYLDRYTAHEYPHRPAIHPATAFDRAAE